MFAQPIIFTAMKKLPPLLPVYNTSKYVLVCSKFYATFLSAIRRSELHHYVYLVDKEIWEYAHGKTTEISPEWPLDNDGLPFFNLYPVEIINEEGVLSKENTIEDAVGVVYEIDYEEKANYVTVDASKFGFYLCYDLSKVFLVCHKDNIDKLPLLSEREMVDVLFAVYKTEWYAANESGKVIDLCHVTIANKKIVFPTMFCTMNIAKSLLLSQAQDYAEVPVYKNPGEELIAQLHEELGDWPILYNFCEAWRTFNPFLIEKYLAKDFIYESQWISNPLNYYSYTHYIAEKFRSLEEKGCVVEASIVADPLSPDGGKMIKLVMDGAECFCRLTVSKKKVVKAEMCIY